ncbi:hypothetical protein B0T10DRAFT_515986 [Thelonectria olida]|uniref:Zn(2)-C6 fungal-type domain-containing protein n=1 Tax=Thelonectria olida TaxID=1576542 RepID=A0A9P9ANT3_9HYPO|nr:hypothetical protein B0T10DRAFT_515986 [Thelonectria olida]
MRLKRGAERASCDFCHRRKIRCDRFSRASQGHASCSQCSLRAVECRLDDSNDVRLRRLRRPVAQTNTQGEAAGAVEEQLGTPMEVERAALSQTDITHADTEPTLDSPFGSHFQPSILSEADSTILVSPQTVDPLPVEPLDILSLDPPFELSAESLLFLDQIFMQETDSEAWGQTDAPVDTEVRTVDAPQTRTTPNLHLESQPQPWAACHLDETSFTAALQAYFDVGALCLPIIFEDAFWQDYNAGRCADALVYAVACRGVPFTTAADKRDIQQRLAHQFREAFFTEQHKLAGQQHIRLDHLEALALMADFEYDGAHGSPLHSHLEDLFLKHDSLVLLTLQNQIQDSDSSEPSATLARAGERRSLFFWHVYGLDAFRSLDRKSISRITDDEIDFHTTLVTHNSRSYLDAILALAFVARRMAQSFCNATVRRKGIDPNDLLSLLRQLDHWSNSLCPTRLRRPRGTAHEKSSDSISPSSQIRLHRAVVWLLEVNCYMQIEDYVAQYGIRDGASLEAEMVALRVEHEALRAVHDATEVSRWNALRLGQGALDYSLADLSPSIIRNICAGVCFWTCSRGSELLQPGLSPTRLKYATGRKARQEDAKKQRIHSYIKIARQLRDYVATATSHKDTAEVLERVNKPLNALEEEVTKV